MKFLSFQEMGKLLAQLEKHGDIIPEVSMRILESSLETEKFAACMR